MYAPAKPKGKEIAVQSFRGHYTRLHTRRIIAEETESSTSALRRVHSFGFGTVIKSVI
jgi:hypothetical protein